MISIVLPAFNEEKYIERCLASLKKQDYHGEYEIIVVDNGSNDRTAAIARELGVKLISCEVKGAFPARDAGARASCGDIIVQADADTVYPSDWLRRVVEHFACHPEASAVAGRFIYTDPPPWWAPLEYFIRSAANFLSCFVLRRPAMISGANFAFRREAFVAIGGYDVRSFSPDQYDIATRLSKVGKVILDKSLKVMTSPRRVKKPFIVIIGEFIRNLAIILQHFLGLFGAIVRSALRTKPAFRMVMALLPLIIVFGYFAHGYYLPDSQAFGKVYYGGDADEMEIALTFDDGPNEPYTSRILDILDMYGIQATFFLIGANVVSYPSVVKRILARGHVIGNHTYTHDANHAVIQGTCREIQITQDAIMSVAGARPHLYRPPHGKKSPWQLQCLNENGLVEVTWNVSTEDQHVKSPETLAQNIIKNARPGGIILMHDGYGTMHNCAQADKSFTVKALPLIVEELRKQGYTFVTVSKLLGVPAYN